MAAKLRFKRNDEDIKHEYILDTDNKAEFIIGRYEIAHEDLYTSQRIAREHFEITYNSQEKIYTLTVKGKPVHFISSRKTVNLKVDETVVLNDGDIVGLPMGNRDYFPLEFKDIEATIDTPEDQLPPEDILYLAELQYHSSTEKIFFKIRDMTTQINLKGIKLEILNFFIKENIKNNKIPCTIPSNVLVRSTWKSDINSEGIKSKTEKQKRVRKITCDSFYRYISLIVDDLAESLENLCNQKNGRDESKEKIRKYIKDKILKNSSGEGYSLIIKIIDK